LTPSLLSSDGRCCLWREQQAHDAFDVGRCAGHELLAQDALLAAPSGAANTPPMANPTMICQLPRPSVIRKVAEAARVVTNALRGLILGQGALPTDQTVGGQVLLALLWSVAITAVFVPVAVRIYRRNIS